MTSETVKDLKDVPDPVADDEISQLQQKLDDVESKLWTFSDRIKLCQKILDDFSNLEQIIVKKSLQDVTLPLQK